MPEWNVFDPECPTRQLLDCIADKWTVLVVSALGQRVRRFGELRRAVGGATPKVLTSALRALERDGVVARRAFATRPLRVEYRLTALGQSLLAVVDQLGDWAEEHMADVNRARNGFDTRPENIGKPRKPKKRTAPRRKA